MGGMLAVSIEKAVAAGLQSRPLAETVADTLAWYDEVKDEEWIQKSLAGIKPEKEATVLAAWHARG